MTQHIAARPAPPRYQPVHVSRRGAGGGRGAGSRVGWLMVAPGLAVLAVFAYWPVLRSAYLSVHGSDLLGRPAAFVGWANYARVVSDDSLVRALGVTVVITVLSVALATGGALAAGLLLRTLTPRPRGVFGVVLSLPFAYSAAAATATFTGLLTPRVGVLDTLARQLGVGSPGWLTDPAWAVVSVAVTCAWCDVGFAVLVVVAATANLDPEVLEAAALDGAGRLRTAWSVVLPMLRPSIAFLLVTQTVGGLQMFTQVQVLTRGGPGDATSTLVHQLYQRAFGNGIPQYGSASALALVLLVLVATVSVVQLRATRERA